MQVAQYLFQSPYTSAVQVGRLEPSKSQSQNSSDTNTQATVKDQTQEKAQELAQTQKQTVKPSVSVNTTPTNILDVRA